MKSDGSVKRLLLITPVVVILTIAGAKTYGFIDRFIPKKNNQPVSTITSSDTRSAIFINPDTDGTDDGVYKLIRLMQDNGVYFYHTDTADGIIKKDDVIILKVNSQWDERGGTNVDLVESVINALIEHPENFTGEIIIADNGQDQFGSLNGGGSLDWKRSNGQDRARSMQDLANYFSSTGFRVSAYSWDKITKNKVSDFDSGNMEEGFIVSDKTDEDTGITVSYPKFISESGTHISFRKGIWNKNTRTFNSDKLKIINMPVLKTHMQYGVTGAVKSYTGVPSDKLTKNSHSTIGLGSMGTLMAETRIPDLNIMDAIYINANTDIVNRGPSTDYDDATFAKTVLVSVDPIALDYYAAGNILYPAVIASGDEITLKNDRDSTVPGSFGYWLRLSMKQLQKSGYDFVMDEERIDLYFADF